MGRGGAGGGDPPPYETCFMHCSFLHVYLQPKVVEAVGAGSGCRCRQPPVAGCTNCLPPGFGEVRGHEAESVAAVVPPSLSIL